MVVVAPLKTTMVEKGYIQNNKIERCIFYICFSVRSITWPSNVSTEQRSKENSVEVGDKVEIKTGCYDILIGILNCSNDSTDSNS